ncbi:MAG TPA: cupin domain-containing protein [Micromonosporaceae bacterium]
MTGASDQRKINKVHVADVVPNRRRGGDVRVVLGPKTAGSTTGFLGTLTLKPGEYVSEHYHPYSEEFLFVLRGRLTLRLHGGSEEIELGPDEGLVVPKDVRHRAMNHGDEDVYAVFHLCPLAPRPELGHVDTEPLPAGSEPPPDVGGPR